MKTDHRTEPVDHDRVSEDDLALRGAYDEAPCPHCGEAADFLSAFGLCLNCAWQVGR